MYHPLVAMETGFTSCNGVFSKAQGLSRYSKLCLNSDSFTGLNEPDNQEKIYISLLAKTEEMV